MQNEVNRIAPLIPTGEASIRQTITFDMFVEAVKSGLLPAVDRLFLLATSAVKRRRTTEATPGNSATTTTCSIQPAAVVVDEAKPYLATRMELQHALQCTPSFALPMVQGTDNSGAVKLARNALQYLKNKGRWTYASHPIWAGAKVMGNTLMHIYMCVKPCGLS